MSVVAFDTLKFARSLREKAKLAPEQAEGFADAIAEAMQGDLATKADLARATSDTKADLGQMRSETKAEISQLRSELKADIREAEFRLEAKIADVRADLIKWTVGSVGLQTVAVLGALFALARMLRP